MSQVVQSRRLRAVDIGKRKAEGRKIIALTAYHAHTVSYTHLTLPTILRV